MISRLVKSLEAERREGSRHTDVGLVESFTYFSEVLDYIREPQKEIATKEPTSRDPLEWYSTVICREIFWYMFQEPVSMKETHKQSPKSNQ